MKLSQGEYVAVERIEALYSGCPGILQLYVHGDSLQSYLLGVVIPDPGQLALLASKVYATNVSPEDVATLSKAIHDAKVKELVLKQLDGEAKKAGLKSYVFSSHPFTTHQEVLSLTGEWFSVDLR